MDISEKIIELKSIIFEKLSPLITSDYYLLEVPYYTNVGDTLIWQGELDFLRLFPYKCLGMYSLDTFPYPNIDPNALILFQGGGNFGDLWTKHHDFKMNVVERYPNNKFIFFPQTIHFEDEINMYNCARFLSQFSNVVICARDIVSYKLLCENFSNQILLVPDMAFYMDMSKWTYNIINRKTPLLLKRRDKELRETDFLSQISDISGISITDWPTMESHDNWTYVLEKLKHMFWSKPIIIDLYCRHFYRPYLIKSGIKILMQHGDIYSTRLHATVLSVLLGKPKIFFLDNSYGKNKYFYDTWLYNCEAISFISDIKS